MLNLRASTLSLQSLLTTGVKETRGKLTLVVVDTGGKFTAGVVSVDVGKDVTIGVNDTVDKFAAARYQRHLWAIRRGLTLMVHLEL
jgi:hypothetical protein